VRRIRVYTERRCGIATGHDRASNVHDGRKRGRSVAVKSMEATLDTEEKPPELDERTIKELMDMGTIST
jgi:hypothetical protein